jgi:hypothetical protein
MNDVYENIFRELSKKLPRKEDIDLLKMLLDVQREGGGSAVKKKIKMFIQEMVGE